jgi:uncharacterized OsmC-like protein
MLNTVSGNIVNDIDLTALGEVVAAVQADAAKGKAGFHVTTRWQGQTKSETTVEPIMLGGERIERGQKIVIDEPNELLGTNAAPNPQEFLMAAVNACMMVGYVAGASLHGIRLDSLEIETKGELDLRGFLGLSPDVPAGYPKIEYIVRIKGDGTPAQFEEIHRNVMATSPNFYNLNRPVAMLGELRIG